MTEKPSESLNHWGTFPQRNKRHRFPGTKSGWLHVLVLALLSMGLWLNCGNQHSYEILDTPYQIVDQWGKSRAYTVYIPSSRKGIPLLVYFHGVMSDGFNSIPALADYTGSPVEETGLVEFCRRNHIMLLAPRPAYTYTFLNRRASGWLPFEREADGVEQLIDRIIKEYPVSAGEVYLAGISAGAGFCHHLANHRPGFYSAILSHSQGYVNEKNDLLKPGIPGPQFGVVFAYTRGDYDNLVDVCVGSERIYRQSGYQTVLLKNLAPINHSWDRESNRRFWRYLKKVGRHLDSTNVR